MKLRIPVVAVLTLFVAVSCDQGLPTAAPDEAEVTETTFKVIQNDKVDFVWPPVLNTCTGEELTLVGRMHMVTKETFDSAGGVHLRVHWQPMGMRAYAPSGMVCQANAPSQDNYNFRPNEQDFFFWPQTYTRISNFRFTCPGPRNDIVGFYKWHITVNANGVATVFAESLRSECIEPGDIPI